MKSQHFFVSEIKVEIKKKKSLSFVFLSAQTYSDSKDEK